MKYEEELQWIVDKIKNEGVHMDKMIIYCPTMKQVENVSFYLERSCGDSLYSNSNLIMGVYHKNAGDFTRKAIVTHFSKPSFMRVVVCTVAFGMGINVSDIRYVVHWGLSKNALAYWQEIGRAGRDGQPSQAFLYVVPALLSRKVDQLFRDDCKLLAGMHLDISRDTAKTKGVQVNEIQATSSETATSTVTPAATSSETTMAASTLATPSIDMATASSVTASSVTTSSSGLPTEMSTASTVKCFRSMIMKHLHLPGMPALPSISHCSGSDCVLQKCCTFCEHRCICLVRIKLMTLKMTMIMKMCNSIYSVMISNCVKY